MQSVLGKEEGLTGSSQIYQVETPASRKSTPDQKKVAPFCDHCFEAESQNPRNIPANGFIDRTGFLWHCRRPECERAVWNLDHQYIIGCRVLDDRCRTSPEIRKGLEHIPHATSSDLTGGV